MPAALINVSNRLPVTVGETIKKSSGGLVAALEGLGSDSYDLKWIGWPGAEVSDPARREEVERVLSQEHGCIPVFLNAEEEQAHYEGFSNSSIWPLLHYMPNYMRYEPAWWEQHQLVSERFADKVIEIAHEGDLVWVHDYQLLLLPALLRKRMPSLKIGFFLHTPFPSYEVFRCHPRRAELLEGMLGADQIGFHTFSYLRHFRSCVLRLLGIDSDLNRVRNGRSSLGVYPIGINAAKFEETLDSPDCARRIEEFRALHASKQVVVSVERMDYTKGILHRLDAIDSFLADAADRDRVRFIFVSVPSREGIEEYQALREEVESRVGRINGKYATLDNSPIQFIHGSVEFVDMCALYAIADIGLITPLIDGMNLVAKEYLACQREGHGALILSEFAGAAEELFNAVIVNPYDAQAVAASLAQALALPAGEKRARNEPMRERVMKYDAQHWARSYIDDLAALASPVDEPDEALDELRRRLKEAIAEGRHVGLFLDYDGTLREITREASAASPHPPLQRLLEILRGRTNVDVTIISGRTSDRLREWFEGYPFALIAEHGASIRRKGGGEWEALDGGAQYSWKPEVHKILDLYAGSTPGTFVEEKRTSLVWHYRKADPDFGAWKANELAEELGVVLANEPVLIRHGKKIVEVCTTQVSKGMAVGRLLESEKYDLALCIGDDLTDEGMFALERDGLLTVKVGDGQTQAKYRVESPAALRDLLAECLGER